MNIILHLDVMYCYYQLHLCVTKFCGIIDPISILHRRHSALYKIF